MTTFAGYGRRDLRKLKNPVRGLKRREPFRTRYESLSQMRDRKMRDSCALWFARNRAAPYLPHDKVLEALGAHHLIGLPTSETT